MLLSKQSLWIIIWLYNDNQDLDKYRNNFIVYSLLVLDVICKEP